MTLFFFLCSFPNCLCILDLLQIQGFRDQCANPSMRETLVQELKEHQKNYGRNKYIPPEHRTSLIPNVTAPTTPENVKPEETFLQNYDKCSEEKLL